MKWINIYKDENGRFISNDDFSSYKQAYEERDSLSTYVETVAIVRQSHPEKGGEEVKKMLIDSNELIRSFYSIAARYGKDTNWDAFLRKVESVLSDQQLYHISTQDSGKLSSPPPEGQDERKGGLPKSCKDKKRGRNDVCKYPIGSCELCQNNF